MNNIVFVHLEHNIGKGANIKEGTITVSHHDNKVYRLTINRFLAKELIESDFLYLRLAINTLTGQIYLVFTKEYMEDSLLAKHDKNGFRFQNKSLVMDLVRRMNLQRNATTTLKISENLSNFPAQKTYEILR